MHRTNRRRRGGVALAVLVAALAAGLAAPIPTLPDDGRREVAEAVAARLPGWQLRRVDPSWEGAYTVVARCVERDLGFQYVPGHGLPAGYAWVQPNDAYARERLTTLSDSRRYLLWEANEERPERLTCAEELARSGDVERRQRTID